MQPIASLRPGQQGGGARRDQERQPRDHAAARLQDLPRRRRRRERRDPLHVDEPGVPRRHPQAASAGRRSSATSSSTRPGLHFMNPEYELVVGRPRRACTPGASCRSTRRPARSRRTCSGKLVRQALDELPAEIPDAAAARSCARGCSSCRGAPAIEESHFPAERSVGRRAQRVPHAGAAAADLRGVLPLSDRPRLAAACDAAPS